MHHLRSALFPRLNPAQVEYSVVRTRHESAWFYLSYCSGVTQWTRTDVLVIAGSLLASEGREGGRELTLGVLPRPSLPYHRTLRLHLSTLYDGRCVDAVAFLKLAEKPSCLFHRLVPELKSVVLVVRSEEERKEVEAAIKEVGEKFRSLFVVELME